MDEKEADQYTQVIELRNDAEEFMQVAHTLESLPVQHDAVQHFLVGHALELALKALLHCHSGQEVTALNTHIIDLYKNSPERPFPPRIKGIAQKYLADPSTVNLSIEPLSDLTVQSLAANLGHHIFILFECVAVFYPGLDVSGGQYSFLELMSETYQAKLYEYPVSDPVSKGTTRGRQDIRPKGKRGTYRNTFDSLEPFFALITQCLSLIDEWKQSRHDAYVQYCREHPEYIDSWE
jgi:hypothetical protein